MKPWIANIAGLLTAGATLGLGLVAGAPEAEANTPSQPMQLASPSGTAREDSEVSLGDSMVLNGQATQLSMFWTSDDVETVLKTYAEVWKDQTKPVVHRRGPITSLSVLDATGQTMRSVMIQDNGDLRLVVPSMTDVRTSPSAGPESSPVPVPENARAYMSQTADDATSLNHHSSYFAPMAAETALEFYTQELGRLGYQVAPKGGFGKNAKLQSATFVRGPETVNIVATPVSNEAEGVHVVVDHVRAIPQEAE
jgi:hypothetical protein